MAWEIKKVTLKVIDNNKTVDKLFFFGCPGTVQKSGVRYDNTSFGVSKLRMQEIECIQMKFSTYPSKWNNGKVMEVLTFRI